MCEGSTLVEDVLMWRNSPGCACVRPAVTGGEVGTLPVTVGAASGHGFWDHRRLGGNEPWSVGKAGPEGRREEVTGRGWGPWWCRFRGEVRTCPLVARPPIYAGAEGGTALAWDVGSDWGHAAIRAWAGVAQGCRGPRAAGSRGRVTGHRGSRAFPASVGKAWGALSICPATAGEGVGTPSGAWPL